MSLEQSDLLLPNDFEEVEGEERAAVFARLNASLHEHYVLPTDDATVKQDQKLAELNATIAQVGENLAARQRREEAEQRRIAAVKERLSTKPREGNEPAGKLTTEEVKGGKRKSSKGVNRINTGVTFNVPKQGADVNFAAEQAELELLREAEEETHQDETV